MKYELIGVVLGLVVLFALVYAVFACYEDVDCAYAKEIELCNENNMTLKGVEYGVDGDFIYCKNEEGHVIKLRRSS